MSPDRPRRPTAPTRAGALALALVGVLSSGACKLPTVNLGTEAPIVVDITMRVDLYQHTGDAPPQEQQDREAAEVVERQRNRMAEIQELKNNRLVGENHRALLTVRETPAGDYGTYVKETTEAENEDRTYLMRQEAKRRNLLLSKIQAEQWASRVADSFKGEWVEVAGKKEGTYAWVQKRSDTEVE